HDRNRDSVFEGAQLFEFFGGFERRNRKFDEAKQGLTGVTVDAQVFQEGKAGELLERSEVSGVAKVRDGPPGKVESPAGTVENDFNDIGVVVLAGIAKGCGRGGHFVFGQSAGHYIDDGWIDERFVSLDIYEGIARMALGNFGDAVRAAGV